MTLLVSDEADLVEANLDYHLDRGVDFVVVTANRASKEVTALLRPYLDRGVARVIREEADTWDQTAWVTRMARLAASEHGADWVINCDADEFYWPHGGSLKEVLAAIPPEYGSLVMPVCHFVPRPDEDGFFADRLTVRETRSLKPGTSEQFAKTAHRGTADVEVSRGNHRVSGSGLEPVPAWRPILGLHFPLRSFAQFERKVITGGRALANNPDPKVSRTARSELYELHRAGGLPAEYARQVLDAEAVRAGVSEGRLVVDERLAEFFRTRAAEGPVGSPAADPRRVEALRVEMARAMHEADGHPLAVAVRDLEMRLARAERRRAKATRHLEKSEFRRERAEARAEAMKAKLEAVRRRRADKPDQRRPGT